MADIETNKSNPNGANQYNPDPRQQLFLSYYKDPKSETFSNAYQSALKAGYEESYASNITVEQPEWLKENIGEDKYQRMLKKAEKNLEEFLEMETTNAVIVGEEVVQKKDSQLVKIKQDTTKFVSERLGKLQWSQRNELTGKDGAPLSIGTVLNQLDDIGSENKGTPPE